MKRCLTIVLVLLGFGLSGQNMDEVEILSQQLSPNMWMLEGSGGNMVLLKGDQGAILIDDQFAPLSEKIIKTVKDLTGQSVTFVINTHWHGDHTGGNENLGKAGAVIVAHQNVRERMSVEQFSEAFQRTTPASPAKALPIITFNDELNFYWGGEHIHIVHVANAHTDGDAMVWFKTSNVLHVGDTWFNGGYPYIDVSSGGSSAGILKANQKALEIADEHTRIICGHGKLGNAKQLKQFHDVVNKIRERVASAIDQGMDAAAIIEADPFNGMENPFKKEWLSKTQFIQFLYDDLVKNGK